MLVDAYIRVSQVAGRTGDRFISPSLQLERIERWAKLHDATIVAVHEELDESGARADRPLLMKAIERVEAGATEGIVVARIDRFGRSLLHSIAAIERIQTAGGRFVSVDNSLDSDTDTGKLVLRLLLSLAEWDLDRIRTTWADACRRAIDRGLHVGTTPTGYRATDKGLRPDPRLAPWVTELFRRRAQGATIGSLARWLGDNVTTSQGRPTWTQTTVCRILHSRIYLGEVRHGEHVNRNAHPPLTDPGTFEQAQIIEAAPVVRGAPGLLSQLVRCANCRYRLHGRHRPDGPAFYVCAGRHTPGRCPRGASIVAAELDAHINRQVEQRLDSASRHQGGAGLADAQHKLDQAEAALSSYRDNAKIGTVLGPARYADGLEQRMRVVNNAARAVYSARLRGTDQPITLDDWHRLDAPGKREALRDLVDCVFLYPARLPAADRAFICWKGEAPLDLPRREQTGQPVRRFNPSQTQGAARRRRPPLAWRAPTDEQILRDLQAFIGDRTTFPARRTFLGHGQSSLYGHLLVTGGIHHWANRIGVPTSGQRHRVQRARKNASDPIVVWP